MKRAVIYARVDSKDRTAMAPYLASAEALCNQRTWAIRHLTDSAGGHRPPLQFAKDNQLIRPQLTRLLSDVKAGNVDVLVFCTSQALATTDELREKLTEFILGHGFNREHLTGDDLECYVRASAPDLIK